MTTFAAMRIDEFLAALAGKSPTPGGGAGASIVGAVAASLAGMVVSYSIGKKNLAEHQPALLSAQARLTRAAELMMRLADEDAAAYGAVNELSRLPETDARRQRELPPAQAASVQVPTAVLAAASDLLRLMEDLAPITNRHLRSDLGIAAALAEGAARSAWWNIFINAESMPADSRAAQIATADTLRDQCVARAKAVEDRCRATP